MYARRALLHAARLGEWVTLGTQAAICRFTLHAAHLYALPARDGALWERGGGYRKHYKLLQYVLTEKGPIKIHLFALKMRPDSAQAQDGVLHDEVRREM